MEISKLTDHDVYPATVTETVARQGRSFAEIRFALCDDGCYRFSLSLQYSYGGYGGPIFATVEPFASLDAARTAALEKLLADWPNHWWDPASVHEELRRLRTQVEAKLTQPSLF